MEDAGIRSRHSIAHTCPPPSAVRCLSLYPWHLVTMEQTPYLVCLSVIFVIFSLVRKQKWAMRTRIKASRPWRSCKWITWILSRYEANMIMSSGCCRDHAGKGPALWGGWSETKPQSGEEKWYSCCCFLIRALLRCLLEGLGAVGLMGHSPGPVVQGVWVQLG